MSTATFATAAIAPRSGLHDLADRCITVGRLWSARKEAAHVGEGCLQPPPGRSRQRRFDGGAQYVRLHVNAGVDEQCGIVPRRVDVATHGKRTVVAGHIARDVVAVGGEIQLDVGNLGRAGAEFGADRLQQVGGERFQSTSPLERSLAEAFIQPNAASPAA